MKVKILFLCVLLAAFAAAVNAQPKRSPAGRALHATGQFFTAAVGAPQPWFHPSRGQKVRRLIMLEALGASIVVGAVRGQQYGLAPWRIGTMVGIGVMGGLTANHAYNFGQPNTSFGLGLGLAGMYGATAYYRGPYTPRATIFGPPTVAVGPPTTTIVIVPGGTTVGKP